MSETCTVRPHQGAEVTEDVPSEMGGVCCGKAAVPRPERFVHAIRCGQTAHSFSDCSACAAVHGLAAALSSEGVMRDESAEACKKMIHCVAEAMRHDDRRFLAKAVRVSFAQDERDQVMVVRLRAVAVSPHVTVREFLGPTVIDAGWNAEACSKATMQALTNVCRVESGRRAAGRHDLTGEGDYIDEALLAHLRSVIVAGTSDGALVELQGIHRLKVMGELPALRYQFRDKAHVTRCVLKGTLKHAGRGAEMMEALISGPNAFAKKCDTLVALNSCG